MSNHKSVGWDCPFCKNDKWEIQATMIVCCECNARWGRVNNYWVEDLSEQKRAEGNLQTEAS